MMLPGTHSSPSPRRFRLERGTVTNCERSPQDRVPSPRVKRAQVSKVKSVPFGVFWRVSRVLLVFGGSGRCTSARARLP